MKKPGGLEKSEVNTPHGETEKKETVFERQIREGSGGGGVSNGGKLGGPGSLELQRRGKSPYITCKAEKRRH